MSPTKNLFGFLKYHPTIAYILQYCHKPGGAELLNFALKSIGTGHYLWPGEGPRGKSGGGYKIFLMDRELARKKIEKARVGIEIFLL